LVFTEGKVTTCTRQSLTVDRCLARQDNDNQLETGVGVLEIAEHWLHLVSVGGILTEARLAHDGHAGVR